MTFPLSFFDLSRLLFAWLKSMELCDSFEIGLQEVVVTVLEHDRWDLWESVHTNSCLPWSRVPSALAWDALLQLQEFCASRDFPDLWSWHPAVRCGGTRVLFHLESLPWVLGTWSGLISSSPSLLLRTLPPFFWRAPFFQFFFWPPPSSSLTPLTCSFQYRPLSFFCESLSPFFLKLKQNKHNFAKPLLAPRKTFFLIFGKVFTRLFVKIEHHLLFKWKIIRFSCETFWPKSIHSLSNRFLSTRPPCVF